MFPLQLVTAAHGEGMRNLRCVLLRRVFTYPRVRNFSEENYFSGHIGAESVKLAFNGLLGERLCFEMRAIE